MLIYLSILFITFEILSTIFNHYFYDITIFGIIFPVNISVIFFCIGFFLLDIVTEIYTNKEADQLIYGKILCQIIFVTFGKLGIVGAGLQNSQLDHIISTTPSMILNGIIASLIGYKITTSLMQKLKILYNGRFLPFRYICSSLPGEIIFSLIFSSLSFSHNKTIYQFIMIFISLTIFKIILSFLFSLIIIPITRAIKYLSNHPQETIEFMPFT